MTQQVVVAFVGADYDFVPVAGGAVRQAFRAQKLALRAGYAGQDGARRVSLRVKLKLGEGALCQRHLVGVVIYDEIAVKSDMLALAPQHIRAEGVERGGGEPLGRLP